jgi:hypothetical protein
MKTHSRPAHLARPAPRAKLKKVETPAKEYPPGYFLEPVYANGTWPPMWRPAYLEPSQSAACREAAIRSRQQGKGWASGTILMPGTPKHLAPTDMEIKK